MLQQEVFKPGVLTSRDRSTSGSKNLGFYQAGLLITRGSYNKLSYNQGFLQAVVLQAAKIYWQGVTRCRRLSRILDNLDLHIVIKEPTRVTETSPTITDLLITSDTSKITASRVFDLGSSDHCLIYS